MRGGEDNHQLAIQLAGFLAAILFFFYILPEFDLRDQAGPPFLSWAFLRNNPILMLPVVALAGIGGIWYAVGREPLRRSVAVQYSPPLDLSPAEASALLEESVKARAIIATLVDLAVRGYLSIEQAAGSGGHPKNEDCFLRNLRRPNWANELAPHELGLMEHIFEYGEQPSLSTLRHGLPEYVPQIKEHIFTSLAAKKIYRLSPIWSGTILMLGGFAILAFLWLLANAFNVKLTDHEILNPACFALAMSIIIPFSRRITLKSALGAERWRQVKGFQDFMGRVEGEHMKSISPDLVEKFLPYAIALGVEKQWTANFKGMLTRPLSWYAEVFMELASGMEG
ncbi:MAG TPA: DUF2207 domain-containing protein [Candidatus Angelobacter sp.]|nr:DUF2207 domain-containing protein [Candidatus Angelobacter sp.]